MKHVGVREFRDHATQFLAGDEVLAIERHGVPIGYYWPVGSGIGPRRGSKEAKDARERLERTIEGILHRTGHTEEELAHFFDLSIPIEQL
jgi:hypothetical protein